VGKNTLISKYLNGFHLEDLKLTIGVDFYTKDVVVDGQKITLKIWVMTREERFRFLLSRYCMGTNGTLILYDITNRNTLEHITEWTQILRKQVGDIPIILIGTKLDLEESRLVSREEAISLAKSERMDEYMECSTKTGENIEKVFDILTRLMLQKPYNIKYS
ncbi:MAG: Rab family GTPase, partial [Promethearchaeota archaeon]